MRDLTRASGAVLLGCVALALPLSSACGGCPRAAANAAAAANAGEQPIAAHETPEHLLILDDAHLISAAADPISPGPLDPTTVHAVIASQSADLRRCYERALSERRDTSGRVVVELSIAREGAVRDVSILENTLGDALLADCFADHARHWRFPESTRDTTLRYPFELQPAAAPAPAPVPGPPASSP